MVSFLLFMQAEHIVCLCSNDLQDLPLHLLDLMTMLRINQQYYLVVDEIDVVRFMKHSWNFRMTVIRSLSVKIAVDCCSISHLLSLRANLPSSYPTTHVSYDTDLQLRTMK